MDESQESGGLDRLSDLPDSLILEILSLLSSSISRDLVRTTILSKRWKDVWTTVPGFDFDFRDEDPNFIRGALAQWKGAKRILDFRIAFINRDPPSSDIMDSLLVLAMEKQVEELSVHLKPIASSRKSIEYYAPQRVYSCSSLTTLSLSYCSIQIEENVQWNQLLSLTLEHGDCVKVSAVTMNRILTAAPRLEQLILRPLEVFREEFCIRSTSLKFLEIGFGDYDHSVMYAALVIWAPNLLLLEFSGDVYATCSLDVPSLTNATLDFIFAPPPLEMLASVRHVESLTLSDECIQLFHKMKEEEDMFVQFSNVKFLKLTTSKVDKMLHVLDMFPQLVTLYAQLDERSFYYNSMDLEFDEANAALSTSSLLHLKTVDIDWQLGDALILPFLKILLQNARVLEEIVFRWKGNPDLLPGLPDLSTSYQTIVLVFI